MVEKEDEFFSACVTMMQTILYGASLLLGLAFFAIAGIVLFPIILIVAVLDWHVNGDKDATTNRKDTED